MAETTITKQPDAYCYQNGSVVSDWNENGVNSRVLLWGGDNAFWAAYRLTLPFDANIELAQLELSFDLINEIQDQDTTTFLCEVFDGAGARLRDTTLIDSATLTLLDGVHGYRTFLFRNMRDFNTSEISFRVAADGGYGRYVSFPTATLRVVYTPPTLSITPTPNPVYAEQSVTLAFTNRISQSLTVTLTANDSTLDELTADSDELTILCPTAWLDNVSPTTNTLIVTVTATDALERSATAQFVLKRPFPTRASPVAPRSARLEGSNPINFAWSVDATNGAQTEAQLQWSTDNAIWEELATVSGSGTTWTVPRVKFPPGTIYWRVRVKNEFDIVGPWSSAVTFTVAYAATAQVVPVDSPTSGVINAQVDRVFSVMLEASGATYEPFTIESATFYWRARSSGPFTAISMEPNADRASVLIEAGTFPSGTLQWDAEATDNTGRTTLTDTYTISTLGAEVEAIPVSPIDTVESGSSVIVFRWDYGSIDGSPQKSVDIQISTDGETWTSLATVTGSAARSYEAAASTFDAGLVYWRIRATSENDVTGPWSRTVSFIALAAPLVQGVAADGKPFVTVTWQVNGQLAFEIDIDGRIYGDYGANVRSYTWPEPMQTGLHSVKVRAQNQYGLWSEWASANFYTFDVPQTIVLSGTADESVHLSWTGGEATIPVITVQPVDMWATEGLVSFSVDAVGTGIHFQWLKKTSPAAPWIAASSDDANNRTYTAPVAAELDGVQFKCVARSAAGVAESSVATFHYEAPAAPPVITIQPKDVFLKSGTVYIYCGADGSSYEWYRRQPQSFTPGLTVIDQNNNKWHIPYDDVAPEDLRVTDGSDDRWHFPAGEGDVGAVLVTDGSETWNMPAGSAEGAAPAWEPMGVNAPFITFSADESRSGEEYYCRATNEIGSTDSRVAVYLFEDPPAEEGGVGDYYVYRDGELLDRTTVAHFEDRTALGEHTYVIFNRLINNNAARSNAVTLTVAVRCLTIGLLSGGPWQTLRWSDRENRELTLTRSREVRWTHYAGARFPEADVGEAEDLVGSFDAAWLAKNREQADAFEDLLGEEVVVKTPRGVVVVGVLAGYDRRDPRFYKSYSFEVRQEDWGGRVDA